MYKKELYSIIFTLSCSYIWKAAHEAHFIIFNQLLIIIIIINHIKISQHYPISLQCFWLNNDQPIRMWLKIIRLWTNMKTITMSVPSITTYNKSCRVKLTSDHSGMCWTAAYLYYFIVPQWFDYLHRVLTGSVITHLSMKWTTF